MSIEYKSTSIIQNNSARIRDSFLNETLLTGVETIKLTNINVESILTFVTECWKHEEGSFFIPMKRSGTATRRNKPRNIHSICKGYNDFGNHDGSHDDEGVINKEKNTIAFNLDELKLMFDACKEFRHLMNFVQSKYKVTVTSGYLLRQSSRGVTGVK